MAEDRLDIIAGRSTWLFIGRLLMTSTLVDRNFLNRHQPSSRSIAKTAEHDARIEAAAPSEKRALKLSLERHSPGKPDGLAIILVDYTLFAGKDQFRRDERKMREAVKMGDGSDLSRRLLKFGGLEVEMKGYHLVCHQKQYIAQKMTSFLLSPGTR